MDERFAEAEPLHGTTVEDQSLRGLFTMLGRAFDKQLGRENQQILRKVLDPISQAIQSPPEVTVVAEVDRKGRDGEAAILKGEHPGLGCDPYSIGVGIHREVEGVMVERQALQYLPWGTEMVELVPLANHTLPLPELAASPAGRVSSSSSFSGSGEATGTLHRNAPRGRGRRGAIAR